LLAAFIVVIIAFLVWANIVQQGKRPAALAVLSNSAIVVTSTDHSIVLTPSSGATGEGLVFIPGAKVDPYAYMFKLSGIVEKSGLTVVITKPILNLAFFDQRPLSLFEADAPNVTTWLVGGHSLGGVRACMLATDPSVTGLVLFGSYCANDLSTTSLKVLSISGSNDGLSTPAKIDSTKSLLPSSTVFVQIAGANHASFGNYGAQSGDGVATVSSDAVEAKITQALQSFLK
jgi:hypothetical protein